MPAAPVFRVVVREDGHVDMATEWERDRYRRWKGTLVGKAAELILREPKTQRSVDQNRYAHAEPFPKIADHLGYSLPEVKLALLGECFGYHTIDGRECPIKTSTSALSVSEFSQLIEWMPQWAWEQFELHIALPQDSDWEGM
jgi:hypothetical protein